jgi:predicted transposase/invertase (TIGR01784 family)
MIDHDAIFKQLLTAFFVEFLELFASELAALLDREALVFLDKESFADLVDPDRREADLIVRARMAAQDAYLIVHLEHQAQVDDAIDRRMLRYFSRLYDRYNVPIYPIVLCSYSTPPRR